MRRTGAAASARLHSGAGTRSGTSRCGSEVHPAQVAGLFYPAEAGRPSRSDRGSAQAGAARRRASRRRSSSRRTPASSIPARSPRPPSARGRAAPSRRAASSSSARRIASRSAGSRSIRRRSGARRSARRRSRPTLTPDSRRRRGVAVDARPFAGEHSLEMHLVMLQAMLPAPFEILPILVGDAEPQAVAEALRLVWGGPETVIAVSSDLSHFLDERRARSIDSDTARRIETLDADSLDGRRACGFLPIMGALAIAAERDMRVSGLHLATSADAGADASRVVGYGAFAFEYAASARLAEADRALLLSTCMAALAAAARSGGAAPALASRRRVARPFAPARDLRHPDRRTSGCAAASARQPPSAADRGCARERGARRASPTRAFRRSRKPISRGLRLDVSILSHPRPIPAAKRSRARRRARTRPRRAHSRRRQAARAVPAERLAPRRRRARVRPPSDDEGRPRAGSLARRARGEALPRRVVRRAVAAGRFRRRSRRRRASRRRFCTERRQRAQKKMRDANPLRRSDASCPQ